jgi:transcriptional regulator of acetoin/glycerol metabolism
LQNAVERTVALEDGPEIQFEDFEPEVETSQDSHSLELDEVETLAELKHRVLIEALKCSQGKKVPAARALGIGKSTLYRKLKSNGY